MLQLSIVTSCFYVYFLSIAEYDSKIHFTAPPWNPSTEEYLECETQMRDHGGKVIISDITSRRPAFVSAVIFYSLVHDAISQR